MSNTLINDFISLQPAYLDAGQVFSGKPSGTTVRAMPRPRPAARPLTMPISSTNPAVTS